MQLPVRVRVSNPNSVVFGLILTIMTRFPRRVWVQNRYEPVQTGLNRFHVVFFFFSGTFERRHGIFHAHERNTIPHVHPASRLKPSGRKFVHAAGKNVTVHVSYATHIASLHYIENRSTYFVSRRHLRTAYFTTSLQKTPRGQKVKVNKTNTAAFWNVRTKSRLFTQLADWNLADESSCMQWEKHGKNPEKVHRQQTFRVNCRRYG